MAKKIIILNGTACRTLGEVKENWDIDTIYDRFVDGELLTWCQDRNYIQADKIAELSKDDADVRKKLCEIFEIDCVKGDSAENDDKNIVSDVVSEPSPTPTNNTNSVDTTNLVELADEAYRNGNYSKAIELFEKAAESGNTDAMNGLALMYLEGTGTPQIVYKGINLLEKSAELGNVEAMMNLGEIYLNSNLIEVSGREEIAFNWFMKAAEVGNADAMGVLGLLYHNGIGVSRNLAESEKWYKKAIELGDVEAMTGLGDIYMEQSKYLDANTCFTEAANKGDSDAMLNLAHLYRRGVNVNGSVVIREDKEKYLHWLQQAIDFGNIEAEMELEDYNNDNRPFWKKIFD